MLFSTLVFRSHELVLPSAKLSWLASAISAASSIGPFSSAEVRAMNHQRAHSSCLLGGVAQSATKAPDGSATAILRASEREQLIRELILLALCVVRELSALCSLFCALEPNACLSRPSGLFDALVSRRLLFMSSFGF